MVDDVEAVCLQTVGGDSGWLRRPVKALGRWFVL
jgi:hypothetical protein